jgi:hypothetical protein
MKRWIISVIVFLGVGAGLGNLDNLQDGVLPVVAQIALLVAVGLLVLIKAAPDVDKDDVPDLLQGTWFGKLIKWLVPILAGIAAAGGVTMAAGCAAAMPKAPPLVWTGAGLGVEATPDGVYGQASADMEVFGIPVDLELQGDSFSRAVAVCARVDGLPQVCVKYDGAMRLGGILRPPPGTGKRVTGTTVETPFRWTSKHWLRSFALRGLMKVGA